MGGVSEISGRGRCRGARLPSPAAAASTCTSPHGAYVTSYPTLHISGLKCPHIFASVEQINAGRYKRSVPERGVSLTLDKARGLCV